jgi:hypothetical protein
MTLLPAAIRRFFSPTLVLLASYVLCSSLPRTAYAQYIDDLKTIYQPGRFDIGGRLASRLFPTPTPIGDLGNIDMVVDLRGFMPMALPARIPSPLQDVIDLRWFKVPTQKALLVLYFGTLKVGDIANDTTHLEQERFNKSRFLKESDVTGESALWCNLAYDLSQNNGAPMFERIAGSGFESAEPTTVFLTKQSVFVILNFKYSSATMAPQKGQLLLALEFSRSSKKYRTFYELNTTLINKPTSDAFAAVIPYVTKAMIEVGIHAATGQ